MDRQATHYICLAMRCYPHSLYGWVVTMSSLPPPPPMAMAESMAALWERYIGIKADVVLFFSLLACKHQPPFERIIAKFVFSFFGHSYSHYLDCVYKATRKRMWIHFNASESSSRDKFLLIMFIFIFVT